MYNARSSVLFTHLRVLARENPFPPSASQMSGAAAAPAAANKGKGRAPKCPHCEGFVLRTCLSASRRGLDILMCDQCGSEATDGNGMTGSCTTCDKDWCASCYRLICDGAAAVRTPRRTAPSPGSGPQSARRTQFNPVPEVHVIPPEDGGGEAEEALTERGGWNAV